MSFVRKEPGAAFVSIFLVLGIAILLVVALGEKVSPVAGQDFGKAPLDGGGWQDSEFPAVPFN